MHIGFCPYMAIHVYIYIHRHCASVIYQFAAHQLDRDAKQWEDNEMVLAARKMAKLMMQMAKYAR